MTRIEVLMLNSYIEEIAFRFNMGKITFEMIAKSPSHTKKRRDETVQQYVRRLTHLYFSEKNIDEIVSVYDLNLYVFSNCTSWNLKLFITSNNLFFSQYRITFIIVEIYQSSIFMIITFQRSRILDLQATLRTCTFRRME